MKMIWHDLILQNLHTTAGLRGNDACHVAKGRRNMTFGKMGLIFYLEVVQQGFIVILRCEAGVAEIAVGFAPILQTAVVKET